VEIAIIATHSVLLGICRRNSFENPLTLAETMTKKQSG